MGKRWSKSEEAIMRAHFPSSELVSDVAKMLGRPTAAISKKASKMGLKRRSVHQASVDRLTAALSGQPRSSEEIAEIIGITRNAAADMLREGHKAGICHIADHRSCGGRGKDVPLWVSGSGKNAMTDYAIEKAQREDRIAKHAKEAFKAFRDPLVCALFGEYRRAA